MLAKTVFFVLLSGLSVVAVLADTPLYQHGQLLLDEVVAFDGTKARYYRDVAFDTGTDGRLLVVQFSRRPLAVVDEVEVTLFQSETLQASVHAEGILSMPCVALETPAVSRSDSTFLVVLAETLLPLNSVCLPVVAETPFDVSVPLPLEGLAPGEYQVKINNLTTSFTLP